MLKTPLIAPLSQSLTPSLGDGRFKMRSAFALRIFSGRTILNFGVQKRLRAFLNPIFTDGVVTENGICSAAFCESAALRACPLPGGSCRAATEGLQIGGAGKNG